MTKIETNAVAIAICESKIEILAEITKSIESGKQYSWIYCESVKHIERLQQMINEYKIENDANFKENQK